MKQKEEKPKRPKFAYLIVSLLDKPFHITYSKENGLDVGIFWTTLLIGLIFYWIS